MVSNHFYRDFLEAKGFYPSLVFEQIKINYFKYKVTGVFPIIDDEGTTWGTFKASIYFKHRYPFGFALLQEISEHIPRSIDYHVGENGECCVCSPLESMEMEDKPISVLSFIEKYVIKFFANHIHFVKFGFYVNGEYSHYYQGLWEAFEEEFNTKNRNEIQKNLIYISAKPSRNSICYCGSGNKLKYCHEKKVKQIQKLLKQIK